MNFYINFDTCKQQKGLTSCWKEQQGNHSFDIDIFCNERIICQGIISLAALQYDVPIILPGGTSFTTTGDEIADETWPLQRVGLTEIGKDTDDMIFKAIQRQKPHMIQLLYGKIYGNGGLFRFLYDMVNKNKGKIIGDGENCIPNIHADDVASAILATIKKMPIGEKIIIADDTPVTQKEFMYYMAALMGKKKPASILDFIIKFILGNDIYDVIKMNCKVSNH